MRHWHSLLFFQDCTDPHWNDLIISLNANYDKLSFFSFQFPLWLSLEGFSLLFQPDFRSILFLSSRGQFTSGGKISQRLWPLLKEKKKPQGRGHVPLFRLRLSWVWMNKKTHKRASQAAMTCQFLRKEAGREMMVPESSHVSHFPWSCLSCCWLTDVVCSFQARISRVQLDLLQGESDNRIFFHSQQFDMDFFCEVSV